MEYLTFPKMLSIILQTNMKKENKLVTTVLNIFKFYAKKGLEKLSDAMFFYLSVL